MARIPYFDPQTAPKATLEALEGSRKINIFKLIAQSEAAGANALRLGRSLTLDGSLDPGVREVAILRVAKLTGAPYMAHEHHAVSRRTGFSDAKIHAITGYGSGSGNGNGNDNGRGSDAETAVEAEGEADAEAEAEACELTAFERRLIQFVDAVVDTTTAADDLFDDVYAVLGDSKTVELVLVIGFYLMIARVMNTFRIELETGPVDTFHFG